jgi:hypothetical protein
LGQKARSCPCEQRHELTERHVTSDQEGKACLLGLQAAFETARVRQDPDVVFSVARPLGLTFTDGIAWQKTYGAILSSGQELRLEYRSDEPSATLSHGPLVLTILRRHCSTATEMSKKRYSVLFLSPERNRLTCNESGRLTSGPVLQTFSTPKRPLGECTAGGVCVKRIVPVALMRDNGRDRSGKQRFKGRPSPCARCQIGNGTKRFFVCRSRCRSRRRSAFSSRGARTPYERRASRPPAV